MLSRAACMSALFSNCRRQYLQCASGQANYEPDSKADAQRDKPSKRKPRLNSRFVDGHQFRRQAIQLCALCKRPETEAKEKVRKTKVVCLPIVSPRPHLAVLLQDVCVGIHLVEARGLCLPGALKGLLRCWQVAWKKRTSF
jgi:hypothetical protein